jgi:surfeit locus 1 family protein
MRLSLRNWKLAVLAVILMAFFVGMGMWQVSRAREKELLMDSYVQRTKVAPLDALDLLDTAQGLDRSEVLHTGKKYLFNGAPSLRVSHRARTSGRRKERASSVLRAAGALPSARPHEKEFLPCIESLDIEQVLDVNHALDIDQDLRFFRATLVGEFDNAHSVLLDNKIHEGKIGYEVYTPFMADGLAAPILVDRGFIPMGATRRELPSLRNMPGKMIITGMLNFPPAYVSFGKLTDSQTFPLRVEYIQLNELSTVLGSSLFPYVLSITPKSPAAYDLEWQVVTMKPEKHMGYAIQWFAFAFTLLILFVALNRPRIHF